jgi:hypothetical protein
MERIREELIPKIRAPFGLSDVLVPNKAIETSPHFSPE